MERVEAIRKLELLLRVRPDRGASASEAAAAARFAQKLIDRFELQDEVLRTRARDEVESPGRAFTHADMDSCVVYAAPGSTMPSWALTLTGAVMRANGCKGFYTSGRQEPRACVRGFGRPVDLAWCVTLLDHLMAAIEDSAARWSVAERAAGRRGGRTGLNSFRLGAVSEISSRLRENEAERSRTQDAERDEMADLAGSGRAGLVAVDAAISRLDSRLNVAESYMRAKQPRLGAGRKRRSSLSGQAYASGREAGARMSLEPRTRLD